MKEANELARTRADALRRELPSLTTELTSLRGKTAKLLDGLVKAGVEASITAKNKLAAMERRQTETKARELQL